MIACGGSNSTTQEQAPPAFAEKFSHIVIGESQVYFSIQTQANQFGLFQVDIASGQPTGISDRVSGGNARIPFSILGKNPRIVYQADRNDDGIDELYSNLLDGSNEILLAEGLPTNNSMENSPIDWQWMPDGSRIIFRSDPDADNIFEIQSVALDGSDSRIISGDVSVTCEPELCWKIASNSSAIIFKSESLNQTSDIAQNLYSVSVVGTGLIQINQSMSEDSREIKGQP